MSVEIGTIVEGIVKGITNFGAFVELEEGKTGLIHISEVSDVYVRDIRDFLKEGDKVKVKILSVDGNKIGLSTKRLIPPKTDNPTAPSRVVSRSEAFAERRVVKTIQPVNFEDKLSKFIKDSDERLLDLKRHTEARRGGRGASRR